MDIEINKNELDISNNSNKMNINLGASKIVAHEKNHANLDNLDFENSGHTGFQPAGDYVLKNELPNETDPTVPDYVKNITEKDIERWNTVIDLTPYAKKEDIPDTSNFVEDKDYVHTDNNFTDEDKEKLSNLITIDGTETITGLKTFSKLPVSGVTPTQATQLTNKLYVDMKIREVGHTENLGYIDLDEYDGSVDNFMCTLINEGKYKFIDSYDEFEWYVEVCSTDNYVGQTYWGNEEGFVNKYYRQGVYNWDDDTVEWENWTSYLDYSLATRLFASKDHVHYTTVSVDNLRTWLDTQNQANYFEYCAIQTSNNHKFIVKFNGTSYNVAGVFQYIRYQEYYDIEEPNKIYKRKGKASKPYAGATINWGNWYVFEGVEEE